MNTARQTLGGCGTQTAALAFSGQTGNGTGLTGAAEEYNGTSWTNTGSLATARSYIAGCGTQTAGLAFNGNSAGTATEEYNPAGQPLTKTVTGT